MLVILIYLKIFVDYLDTYLDSVWVTLPLDPGCIKDAAIYNAATVVNVARARLWEGLFCAVPNVKDARVEISAMSPTHNGEYEIHVLPCDAPYKEWSPELREAVNKGTDQMKRDLADMLADMVTAHLNGEEERGDPRYEIRRRR